MRQRSVLLLLLCATGCLWRGYGTIMEVHLDVLTQTADKLCSVVDSGRGPTAEGMAEYVYPAQRARQFMRQFSSYSERPSYKQFGVLVDDYEAMIRAVDAARSQGRLGADEVARLKAERDALLATAVEIRSDLKAGT